MQTQLDEIGDRIFRVSTFFPQIGPSGFGFNQFVVLADEPLLYHCGMRAIFPAVREVVARVVPPEKLRWIGFSHVEADECGAMNQWLAVAPAAQVVHGQVGCDVSLNDLADRPPRALADGEALELGGRTIRLFATPHVPHNWEAVVLYEERTRTLLAGDLLTSDGQGPAVGTEDPTARVLETERMFRASSLTPGTAAVFARLADLQPQLLASMHGGSYRGDGASVLRRIGEGLERLAA